MWISKGMTQQMMKWKTQIQTDEEKKIIIMNDSEEEESTRVGNMILC